ncbi:MAG: hypothetical protein ACD_56C00074G0002 [uncultured bacterium]|nr:MAG: hypothetical protein ACD_56C00074G0002 [uncultured bacterium]
MRTNRKHSPATFNLKLLGITFFSFLIFLSFANVSSAIYVYDKEAEDRRNARQIPCDDPYDYSDVNEKYEDYRDRVYEKNCDHIKDKKDKKRCKDNLKPQRSPFIDRYVKDYSGVKGYSTFTDRYVQDYSDDGYYHDYGYPYNDYHY